MGIFLSSALLVAALAQGSAGARPADSEAPPAAAPQGDDGRAQLALGRAYLVRFYEGRGPNRDTAQARQLLDTADQALARAAIALGSPGLSPAGDTARVLRVKGWSGRAVVAWEQRGVRAGPDVWGPLPTDLRLSPVLEELGENLLRACPPGGVLLTASDADSYAAWYMRFVRGLRPDLLVMPLALWQEDSTFRARAGVDLKLGASTPGGWLAALVARRPVCASMGFDRPPDSHGRFKWQGRPLVWVAGGHASETVPPRDFVFAAADMAVQDHDPWGLAALAVYVRAARTTPEMCRALASLNAAVEQGHCRR